MAAQMLSNIYDIPDAGMGGQFALLRAGGDLYAATIARGGGQGRLFVGKPFQLAPIDLDQLGITGALHVELDLDTRGALMAYVSRIIDTDGEDKGRRVITAVDTGIRVGGTPQPSPVPIPTPVPQPVPVPTPLDGQVLAKLDQLVKMLDDDWNAAMKPTVLGVARIEQALADLARRPDGAFWTASPAADGYNLPPEIAGALGRESQQAIALAVGAVLEWALLEAGYPNAEARRFTVPPEG